MPFHVRECVEGAQLLASGLDVVREQQPVREPPAHGLHLAGVDGHHRQHGHRLDHRPEPSAPVEQQHRLDRRAARGPVPHRWNVGRQGEVELTAHQSPEERHVRPELVDHEMP
ncbi:hypothetical protein [Phytomonospora endophytica]|uniref:Uncharacterized protein n=1 Tax=Phytomonospora endophytica TaxID=714109 RepID=A0A841FNG3_9ACTN|nr:hypothetical protein [Phytomonospora endophytica]MBB6033480.1 hypothetical protein [Phytomonospora endophytica]